MINSFQINTSKHICLNIKKNYCRVQSPCTRFSVYGAENVAVSGLLSWFYWEKLRRPGFEPRSSHVGFVVDKVGLRQVFSEFFCFPCQFSFHRLLHTHQLSSGAGTISQLLADVLSGLSLTTPQEKTKKGTAAAWKPGGGGALLRLVKI
jgi:hypothetical protein